VASLYHYAASEKLRPTHHIDADQLRSLLYGHEEVRMIKGVKNITTYEKE